VNGSGMAPMCRLRSRPQHQTRKSERAAVKSAAPPTPDFVGKISHVRSANKRHARDLLQPLPAKKERLLPIEGSVLVSGRHIS